MKTQCNRTYRMQAKWGRKGIVPATAVNEGRRSHQQLQPPTGRRAAGPWGTQEGRNTCHPAAISRRRKWQPTPVFLPGESQGRRGLVGCCLWGCRVGHDWRDLAVSKELRCFFSFFFFYQQLPRIPRFSSVQSFSHVWLFVTPTDSSMPGLPVHQQLLELIQAHVHWVGYATQPSHPLSSPSPPAFNLSQHQGLF